MNLRSRKAFAAGDGEKRLTLSDAVLKFLTNSSSPRGTLSANVTDPTKSRWELRLIPTPIYEYGIADEGVDFGGVFSLCQGTDTELLVLVEARKMAGKSEWYYAFAPFTDYQLSVSIDAEQLWQSPDGTMAENGKPHYWDFVDQQPKPDFEP